MLLPSAISGKISCDRVPSSPLNASAAATVITDFPTQRCVTRSRKGVLNHELRLPAAHSFSKTGRRAFPFRRRILDLVAHGEKTGLDVDAKSCKSFWHRASSAHGVSTERVTRPWEQTIRTANVPSAPLVRTFIKKRNYRAERVAVDLIAKLRSCLWLP